MSKSPYLVRVFRLSAPTPKTYSKEVPVQALSVWVVGPEIGLSSQWWLYTVVSGTLTLLQSTTSPVICKENKA